MAKTPEQQETFDKLMAKGMKIIYGKGTSDKIVNAIKKEDPVIGLKNMTNAIVKKLSGAAQEQGKGISREMVPDLSLGIMSQIAELSKAAGVNIDDKAITDAFGSLSKDKTAQSLSDGARTPEEFQQGVSNLQAKQPQETSNREQQGLTEPSSPTVKGNIPTMTERLAGGLLG